MASDWLHNTEYFGAEVCVTTWNTECQTLNE